MNDVEMKVGAVKIASAWAFVGITSWADVASFFAAMYTLCLLGEWWWKRFWRPLLESRGIIARRARRKEDAK